MYNLHLSPEQLEIRDTVRDFVDREVKPAALNADRLNVRDRSLLWDVLDQASEMGLRALALSEDRGGAGADALTSCIVTEEIAVGDADTAAILTETSRLSRLFDCAMDDGGRGAFLDEFLGNGRFHLALADHEPGTDTRLGINYHRPASTEVTMKTAAARAGDSGWTINGVKDCVANAPIARLLAVTIAMPGGGRGVLLVPADTPGLTVSAHDDPWQHGVCGEVRFSDCRVPAGNLLGEDAATVIGGREGRGAPLSQALNIGIGRAAYEAALDYARLRVQGGRPLIEHQAIATKLADAAIGLEVARAAVWRAAWASDHPEAVADRSLPDLPLQTIAQVFTSEAMMRIAKDCAEIFGAMGVMRDMPLQKYIHDARVCQHSGDGNSEARLRLAEVLAAYRRKDKVELALAGE